MIPINASLIRNLYRPLHSDASKWSRGHALIIAGSTGKIGASILASKSCLRSGVGLLTAHVPGCAETAFYVAVPEVMLSLDTDAKIITHIPELGMFSSIGIGPGIGKHEYTIRAFENLLNSERTVPIVIDADGLNILSMYPELLHKLSNNSVLTPHHREFSRLIGRDWSNLEELTQLASSFSLDKGLILVLKSSSTQIFLPTGEVYINTTGNAGLAKGGSGDMLTGMITSFLAQGYDTKQSLILAVYLHGRAADLAVKNKAPESLLASDVIEYVSEALLELQRH
jgi:NAD(P)H-hydrate epimerase